MPYGMIVEGRGGFYTVLNEEGENLVLRPQKKLKKQAGSLLIGDRVQYEMLDEGQGWIVSVLDRKNSFIRPPVANIELMIIVLAKLPQPDFLLVDKLLVFCFMNDIEPLIVINKDDLGDEAYRSALCYEKACENILSVSTVENNGLDELKKLMKGRLACFAGQSGVGKSSIIRAITGNSDIFVGSLSEKIERGKQTTRHASIFIHDNLMLMDTPGFSLLELPRALEPEKLRDFYPEFDELACLCRFSPCLHDREPDCAVKKAVDEGKISKERHLRYTQLLQDVKNAWRERYDG